MLHNQQNLSSLILAAGLSSRMENFKPLMPFRGKTLIENTIDSVLSGGAQTAVVVTGFKSEELEDLLKNRYGDQILLVKNQHFKETDMMTSIKTGCYSLPPCEAFFLLPGDMPVICPSTFEKLIKARCPHLPSVVIPTLNGYRKHPPLIDGRLITDILSFQGNGGLRQLWRQREELICTVPVDDEGVTIDLDTRQDYQTCIQKYEISGGKL